MNKILSIIAICAILGLATADWTASQVLTQNETKTFGNPFLARYSDNSRVVLIGLAASASGNQAVINRRYLNTSFTKFNSTANDDSYTIAAPANATNVSVYGTWSHDGKVGVAYVTSTNIYVSIFKSDADLNTSSNIQTSPALFANGTYKLAQFYFQDDVFYVVATDASNNGLIQGVASKDASLKSASAVSIFGTVTNSSVKCAQKSGKNVVSFCGYNNAGTYKFKNVSVGADNAVTNEVNLYVTPTVSTSPGSVLVAASNDFYTAIVGFTNANNTPSYAVGYDNSSTPVIYNASVLDNTTAPSNYFTSQEFFKSGVIAVYQSGNSLKYSLIIRNDTANTTSTVTNSTVVLLTTVPTTGLNLKDFTFQDQTYYGIFTDATLGVSVAKIYDGPISSNFASATKCALASIFAVAALLFAF